MTRAIQQHSADYRLAYEFLPNREEIRLELGALIQMHVASHREPDGTVRDPHAVHAICCLRAALLEIPPTGISEAAKVAKHRRSGARVPRTVPVKDLKL